VEFPAGRRRNPSEGRRTLLNYPAVSGIRKKSPGPVNEPLLSALKTGYMKVLFRIGPSQLFILVAVLMLAGCTRTSRGVWTPGWEELASIATPRTGAKAVAVGNHLYVFGGGQGVPGPDTIHASVESADLQPDGRFDEWKPNTALNTPRMFLSVVRHGNTIYALGGEYFPEGNMKLLNTVERTEVREDGSLAPWTDCESMNTPRRSPTSVIVGDYLYAIGGYNGTFLRTVERARILPDGNLSPWEWVPHLLTEPRYIHGGAAMGNRIYVLGGHIEQSGRGSSDAEWTTVGADGQVAPWKATTSLEQPRFLAGTGITERHLFIVGGYDGGYLSSVEKASFQPDGTLSPWTQTSPLSTPREGAAIAISGDNIYAIGGSREGVFLRTVEHGIIAEDGTIGYFKKE
jgi:hypothetical protein